MSAASTAAGSSAPSGDAPAPRFSVIVTVLNEHKHIRDLLDSLLVQSASFEVVVVDAGSDDGTWEILSDYAARDERVRIFQEPGKRGAGRNAAVRHARGEIVAFIDGDCMANGYWLQALEEGFDAGADVVAGRTRYHGFWAFANMQRVELAHRGQDVTWPSCNLAYRRQLFETIGGFDERFVTAEDIDLNVRATEAGARIVHQPSAVVYAQARDSVTGFVRQAFWNGYGRKQLTLKHGRLWSDYRFKRMARNQVTFWGIIRLKWAVMGYLRCKFVERRADYVDDEGRPTTSNAALRAPVAVDAASDAASDA